MLEFILARYNYWIVIALMMTGLYIVFSRGNLVKTLIGLNLFQTSVFIFYITVGKVIGGTAPILVGGEKEEEGHGEGHDGSHGEAAATHGSSQAEDHATSTEHLHDAEGAALNTIDGAGELAGRNASLHTQAEGVPANPLFTDQAAPPEGNVDLQPFETYGEVIYSNPLPHVLILTAIVVGVATTAVGLSLAVRIREAYGTVEEDDLEAIDNATDIAEVAS